MCGTNFGSGANFNSHAHVERDVSHMFHISVSRISTHTLTWSVTGSNPAPATNKEISTHTLTWSVTAFESR